MVTVLVTLGVLVQIITSLTWTYMSTDKLGIGKTTIGEAYFMSGQAIGELIWMLAIRLFVVKGMLVGELVIEYIICLLLVDLISILFLHPFQFELSKIGSFVAATFGYLHRLIIYIKK